MALAAAVPAAAGSAPEPLALLARTGPWPVNSAPIGFGGAIWFANSVKWVNHNSADIWRFDPATGRARYERGLFSQDVGPPLIHRGNLYWPFEDGRAGSLGVAAATDGRRWEEALIPGFPAFHLHALAEWRGGLAAVTGAINGGLHLSDDGGRTWRTLIDLPPRVGRFVRLDGAAAARGRLYLRLDEADGASLVEYRRGALHPLPGWPKTRWQGEPVALQGGVAALSSDSDAPILWFDGAQTRAIAAPEPDAKLTDLHALGADLFAVGTVGDAGMVWRRDGGDGRWTRRARFSGGAPTDLTLYRGRLYVTGAGDDGRGVLWGSGPGPDLARDAGPARLGRAAPLPRQAPAGPDATDWPAEAAALKALLADPESYADHGRALQTALLSAAMRSPPAGFLPDLLALAFPEGAVPTYGGRGQAVRADIARWYILWAMGLARQPTIPPAILRSTWARAPNGPEKWFDPLLIGLWAAGAAAQTDRETLDALVARLDRDDPQWLRAQARATLTAVTGCHFVHDDVAWRLWRRSGALGCAGLDQP